MNKLKTLKEINLGSCCDDFNHKMLRKLRAEAIKRFKLKCGMMTASDWIEFFNLTEEELTKPTEEKG